MTATPRLSVIVVTYNERALVARSLPPLVAQLGPGDELIVADNASSDGTPAEVERVAPGAKLIAMPANEGYMPACNAAAAAASGDILITLDTDTLVAPGFCDAIRAPLVEERGWAAWMGLLTMDGGRRVNTSGGIVHFTGIAWAGEIGRPVEEVALAPHEVGFVSGACLAVTRAAWLADPGFAEDFFLYFDDVDFSLRQVLRGERIGIEPAARVDHLYDFARRSVKWRLLERNRWATLVRTYPRELLVLLAPALVATELALLVVAARGGWLAAKLLAYSDTLRALPRLARERRAIQARRTVSAARFAAGLTDELSSPYLGRAGRSRLLGALLAVYWSAVRRLLA